MCRNSYRHFQQLLSTIYYVFENKESSWNMLNDINDDDSRFDRVATIYWRPWQQRNEKS